MSKVKIFEFIVGFSIGVLVPSFLLAVIPPAWPTFHQNPQRTGLSPYSGPQSMNTIHTFLTGGNIAWSSPVIDFDNETICIGCEDGKLYAINPDGTLKWTYQTDGSIFSCPAVSEEGVIFIGSTDSSIYALEDSITYAKLRWSYKINDKIKAPILLGTDGSVYGVGRELYALDVNGNLKWTYHIGIASSPGGAALSLDGTTIYIQHAEVFNICVAAIDTNGTENWKCDLGAPSFSETTPTVGSDGKIYWAHLDASGVGRIIAINPNGTIEWVSDSIGGVQYSSPAIGSDGTIYVGSASNGFNAINPDGTLKWVFPTDGAVYSSPVVDNEGTIYFGTYDSIFYSIGPDGNLKWNYQTGGLIGSSSPTIDASGKVCVGASDGNLYSFGYSLGIETVFFSAVSESYYIKIQWGLEMEDDCLQYRILKKSIKEDNDYFEIVRVPGSGSSPSPKTYSYRDKDIKPGNTYYYKLGVIKINGNTQWHGPVSARVTGIKGYLRVSPNPFSKTTVISFQCPVISEKEKITLSIHDVSGRLVKSFTLITDHSALSTAVSWDGRDDFGKLLPSGIYFCRLSQGSYTETRKILFVK